jgi:hypothetical protein
MATPTRTQADTLPSKIDKIVDPIDQLTTKKQFDNWVESVLEQNDLDSLINKDLPHPDEKHTKFALWKKASKQVKTWLLR